MRRGTYGGGWLATRGCSRTSLASGRPRTARYLADATVSPGLYNRHRFNEELARMLAEAPAHGSRLALLFFALDDIKYSSTTLGHRAGVQADRVAGEWRDRCGQEFQRLGGDKFAILVPGFQPNWSSGERSHADLLDLPVERPDLRSSSLASPSTRTSRQRGGIIARADTRCTRRRKRERTPGGSTQRPRHIENVSRCRERPTACAR